MKLKFIKIKKIELKAIIYVVAKSLHRDKVLLINEFIGNVTHIKAFLRNILMRCRMCPV